MLDHRRDFTFPAASVLRVFRWHLTHCPPFWRIKQNVTPTAIQNALDRGQLEAQPWDHVGLTRLGRTSAERRRWHAGRVAYLVTHGWEGGIEVEQDRRLSDDMPMLTIHNGCHRLRAAAFRGDPTIDLHVRGDLRLFDLFTGLRVRP